jgi:hypothetical protein
MLDGPFDPAGHFALVQDTDVLGFWGRVIILERGTNGRDEQARPRGGVVTQRTANPRTPVQFRAWPPGLTRASTCRRRAYRGH